MEEQQLARLAVERGMLSQAHLDECLRDQAEASGTVRPSLLAILSQHGYLKPDLVATLINDLGRSGKLARLESELNPSDDFPVASPGTPMRTVASAIAPGLTVLRGRRQIESGLKDSGQQKHPEAASSKSSGREAVADTVIEPAAPVPTPESMPPALMQSKPVVGSKVGRYELVRVLGQGGMGVVYLARDGAIDRLVALKTLLVTDHSQPQQFERFRREVKAAARLNHPHIVAIHDVGQWDGRPYFTMDYIEGNSLADLISGRAGKDDNESGKEKAGEEAADAVRSGVTRVSSRRLVVPRRLRRRRNIPAARAVALLRDVSRAMQHAHDHGIIHRDVKPQNILVDPQGKPYVMDFGLAREVESVGKSLTLGGQIMGTPSYMSPEQARNSHRVTTQADVYSLGAVLYECLAGVPPFDGSTPYNIINKVMHEDPTPLGKRCPGLSQALQTICQKAMEKDPGSRYESAGKLADDLDRFLKGEPIAARSSHSLGRFIRRLRRSRETVISIVTVLTMALVAGWLVASEAAKRREVEVARQVAAEKADAKAKALEAKLEEAERAQKEAEAWQRSEQDRMVVDRKVEALMRQALAANGLNERIAIYDEILVLRPGYEVWMERGRVQMLLAYESARARSLAAFEAAHNDFKQALDKNPEVLNARVLLGFLQVMHLGRAARGREQLQQVLNQDTGEGWVLDLAEGIKRMSENDFEAALPPLDRALAANSPYPLEVHWVRVKALVRLRRVPEALESLNAVVKLSPRWAPALALRGVLRLMMADEKGGEEDLILAIQCDPGEPLARINRGIRRANRGDHRGAIDDLTVVLDQDPKNVPALSHRGRAYLDLGDPVAACRDIDKSCKLSPRDHAMFSNRAMAHLIAGNLKTAIEAAGQALAIKEDSGTARVIIALGLEALGKHHEARKAAQVLRESDPQQARYIQVHWQEVNRCRRKAGIKPLSPSKLLKGPLPGPRDGQ